ncbi:hypothetical protein GOODEAATRI_027924 [Goodea atripinnis]|uniref:Secreted protein n=1 Tax=Goodea atripinnis TaxID=208336 RepID=A0ABV0NYS1_9TELE
MMCRNVAIVLFLHSMVTFLPSLNTTCGTYKQMFYNHRRPQEDQLLPAQSRTISHKITRTGPEHDGKCCLVWISDCQGSDGRVRIWWKHHESMDPSRINSPGCWCYLGFLGTAWAPRYQLSII